MFYFPTNYIEPVFRPPSEAHSLILQVTNGCSYNGCTFCDMYTQPQKKFAVQKIEDIESTLQKVVRMMPNLRRIFLADGDAMVLSYRRLVEILDLINHYFPNLERVSSYCLPRNTDNKTVDELKELAKRKLSLVYVGCESGDDVVLENVKKNETFESSKKALIKLADAGIKRSVMILNGLGGNIFSEQHAINSALLMNETQPEYLSTLVVSFPLGQKRFLESFPEFELPTTYDLIEEMYVFIKQLQLEKTIFRSDHASNYLVLKGVLNEDKESIMQLLESYLDNPKNVRLREEWMRGL